MAMVFERQPKEGAEAFAAFSAYLAMGPERSLAAVGEKFGKSKVIMEKWFRKFDWPARVAAHGAHLALIEREAAEATVRENESPFLQMVEQLATYAASAPAGSHAACELHREGKRAAEAIREILKGTPSAANWEIVRYLGENGLLKVPRHLEVLQREGGRLESPISATLVSLGKHAVPYLISALGEEQKRYRALTILEEMGDSAKAAVPALLALLKDDDAGTRIDACFGLAGVEAGADQVVVALVETLWNDVDDNVRFRAADALGQLGASHALADAEGGMEKVVAALGETVRRDVDPDVRSEAAHALGWLGPSAKSAVRALRRAMMEESELVRKSAAAALDSIGPEVAGANPFYANLIKGLRDRYDSIDASDVRDAIRQSVVNFFKSRTRRLFSKLMTGPRLEFGDSAGGKSGQCHVCGKRLISKAEAVGTGDFESSDRTCASCGTHLCFGCAAAEGRRQGLSSTCLCPKCGKNLNA